MGPIPEWGLFLNGAYSIREQISDEIWMEPEPWHIFVSELLMPDWPKLWAPSRRMVKKHLNGMEPLCKHQQL